MIPCIFQGYKRVQQSLQIFTSLFFSLQIFLKKFSFWGLWSTQFSRGRRRSNRSTTRLWWFSLQFWEPWQKHKQTVLFCYRYTKLCRLLVQIFELFFSLFQFAHACVSFVLCELYNTILLQHNRALPIGGCLLLFYS